MTKQIRLAKDKIDFILEDVNRYLLELAREQIRIAFDHAEKEVTDLRQRTKEGIETARLSGKQIRRQTETTYHTKKSVAAKQMILKKSKDFDGTSPDKEIGYQI